LRKIYKSLGAVEEARARLRCAEEDRKMAEAERKKARKIRSEAEASFAVVEMKKDSETLERLHYKRRKDGRK
jgi:hypothetical protein